MKKFVCGLVVGIMLTTSAVATFAGETLKLIVNGVDITSEAAPIIIDGRTLVPARALAEKLGATVEWDAKNNVVVVTSNANTSQATITPSNPQKPTSVSVKSEAKKVPYEDLFRYPDKYKNSKVTYTGEVGQVVEEGDKVYLRVNVTKKEYWYQDTILVAYNKNILPGRVLKDDIITFWGSSQGIHTYPATTGIQVQIPIVVAEIIEIH